MPSVPCCATRRAQGRWDISSSKAAGGASGATSAGSATSASAMAAMRSKRVHGGVAGAAARSARTSARQPRHCHAAATTPAPLTPSAPPPPPPPGPPPRPRPRGAPAPRADQPERGLAAKEPEDRQRLEGTDVKADAERGRHGGFEPGVAARGWAQAREHRAAGTPAGNHEDRELGVVRGGKDQLLNINSRGRSLRSRRPAGRASVKN